MEQRTPSCFKETGSYDEITHEIMLFIVANLIHLATAEMEGVVENSSSFAVSTLFRR